MSFLPSIPRLRTPSITSKSTNKSNKSNDDDINDIDETEPSTSTSPLSPSPSTSMPPPSRSSHSHHYFHQSRSRPKSTPPISAEFTPNNHININSQNIRASTVKRPDSNRRSLSNSTPLQFTSIIDPASSSSSSSSNNSSNSNLNSNPNYNTTTTNSTLNPNNPPPNLISPTPKRNFVWNSNPNSISNNSNSNPNSTSNAIPNYRHSTYTYGSSATPTLNSFPSSSSNSSNSYNYNSYNNYSNIQRSITPSVPTVTDAVYSFKLLDALRKGDQATLHPFISKSEVRSDQPIPELVSPLHLAVRCAEYSTVELLLTYKSISPNVVDSTTGNTPLHLACSIPRPDVVALLLRQPDVDDTKRNHDGLDCLALAREVEVAQAIQVSRAELNMHYLHLLASYENSPLQLSNSSANLSSTASISVGSSNNPSQAIKAAEAIYHLLDSPRFSALDLNAQSLDSGTTLLHEAVRRKDTRMIETAVRKGADVFCRDRKGKRALESTKDEKVKALLRQFSNSDPALANQALPGQAPVFRGYMGKWTNMAGGYKTRWFVLENGVLSYYHSQEEEGKQSRGSINMRFAKVRADSNDKHRFEVISDTGKGSTKLYLKGSHPVERARWVQVLTQTQDFFNLERTTSRESTTTPSLSLNPSANTSATNLLSSSVTPSVAPTIPAAGSGTSSNQNHRLSRASSLLGTPGAGVPAMTGVVANQGVSASSKSSLKNVGGGGVGGGGVIGHHSYPYGNSNRSPSILSRNDSHSPTSEKEGFDLDEGLISQMPYDGQHSLVENSLRAQVELSLQLVESVGASATTALSPTNGAAVNGNALTNLGGSGVAAGQNSTLRLSRDLNVNTSSASSFSSASSSDARQALASALQSTSTLLNQHLQMTQAREAYLQRRWEQEIRAKTLWEDNMTTLARQHSEMEEQLRQAVQENARKRKALREVRETFGSTPGSVGNPLSPSRSTTVTDEFSTPTGSLAARRAGGDHQPLAQALRMDSPLPPAAASALAGVSDVTNEELARSSRDDPDEAEDDFFDAIESGDLPGLRVQTPLAEKCKEEDWPEDFDKSMVEEAEVAPYRKLRTEMPIGKDDRPSVSLWAILKNNIGKDLTKISFPVSFNEPTSMLQRMAEDMEFSECLDAASLQTNSALRTAFVAAFAMSNYSSTIGRVAKPFNPLLGETFEYARLDKHYRYVSEQVSHHPPISACHAQSPSWDYMGSVDAKSKFLGRSFEIRPTGVAHVNLNIPTSLAPTLPKVPGTDKVSEHFSWNKVTTSVSGFMIGQPTIDHFGDMEVTNHHTKEKCVLTFKPRGWRGKDAFEIKGAVYDKSGNVSWEIAGRWNSQLVARRVGAGPKGDLNPDEQLQGTGPPLEQVGADGSNNDEYVLLWKNSEKPPTPFNLTPFAITLNQMSTELRPWLAPTDCRLRPDLSAFESGKFDEANDLKAGLENYQRETRKKRETGELPPHNPRWFQASVDPDTNEQIWRPHMQSYPHNTDYIVPEYWNERGRVGKAKILALKRGETCKEDWENTVHIFGNFEAPEPTAL